MADNTRAFFLHPKEPRVGGAGIVPASDAALFPEAGPAVLWGQGTPDGDRAPFTLVNKGSLYLAVDQTDDTTAVWLKVDEGSDNADWVRLFAENHALIDTADLAAAAGITVEQLESNARLFFVRSDLFDISAADSEQVVLHAVAAMTIKSAYLVWQEATTASGAAEGDITIGVATGGAGVVGATAYAVSKASGSKQALTIASGAVAAGESVFVSHDVADGAAGTYYLFLEVELNS